MVKMACHSTLSEEEIKKRLQEKLKKLEEDPQTVAEEEVKRRLQEKLKKLEVDPQTAAEQESQNRSLPTQGQQNNVPQVAAVNTSQLVQPVPPAPQPSPRDRAVVESDDDDEIDWDYVDGTDNLQEILLCGVCMTVLQDPLLLTCCGDQLICKQCLSRVHDRNRILRQNPQCPFCRSEEFKAIPNTDVNNMIQELKVWCPKKDKGCKWVGTLREAKEHINVCPLICISCPNNCQAQKFERQYLKKHLAECNAHPIFCPFGQIGCDESVPRKDIPDHSRSAIHCHLLSIAKANAKLSAECRASVQSLDSDSKKSFDEKSKYVLSLQGYLSNLQTKVGTLETNLQNKKKVVNDLLTQNAKESSQYAAQLRMKSEEAFRLRKLSLGLHTHLESLHVPVVEGYIPIPVTFTLDKFSERKANDDDWLSPPFYTHLGGYKMCLSIGLNVGTHLSIFLHLMKGEHDDRLVWPFPGAVVTVLILNQRNTLTNMVLESHGHARQYFQIEGKNWQNVCKRVTDVTYGPGRGWTEFISHSQVGRYITNDTLKVKVHHIDFLPL